MIYRALVGSAHATLALTCFIFGRRPRGLRLLRVLRLHGPLDFLDALKKLHSPHEVHIKLHPAFVYVRRYRAFHITWPYLEKALFYAKLFPKLDFALYTSPVSSNLVNFLRYSHILHILICFTN